MKRKPNLQTLLKKAKAAVADLELSTKYASEFVPSNNAMFMAHLTAHKAATELNFCGEYLDRIDKETR